MDKITNCEGCSACCQVMLIRFSGVLPEDYKKARGIRTIGPFMALSAPCPQLKDGKCGIYPTRPRMCGAFPIGGLDCVLCRKLGEEEAGKKKGVGGE